jgi:hypothetical protein
MDTMTKLPFLLVWTAVLLGMAACAGEGNDTPTDPSTQLPNPTLTPDTDASYTRRIPFVPLDDPDFLSIENAAYLGDDELILGVEWGDEARAYPVQMLTYHHIVNDHIGGKPFLITY